MPSPPLDDRSPLPPLNAQYRNDFTYNATVVFSSVAILKDVITPKIIECYNQYQDKQLSLEALREILYRRIMITTPFDVAEEVINSLYFPYYDVDLDNNIQRTFHTPQHPDDITSLTAKQDDEYILYRRNKMQAVRAATHAQTADNPDELLDNIAVYLINIMEQYGQDLKKIKHIAMLDLAAAGHDTVYHSDGKIRGKTLDYLSEVLDGVEGTNGAQLQWNKAAKTHPQFRFLYKMLEHKAWAGVYDNPPAGPGPNEALSAINLVIAMIKLGISETEQAKVITTVLNTKPFDNQIAQYRFEAWTRYECQILQELHQVHKLKEIKQNDPMLHQRIVAAMTSFTFRYTPAQNAINELQKKADILFSIDRGLGLDSVKYNEALQRMIKETGEEMFQAIRSKDLPKARKLQEKSLLLKAIHGDVASNARDTLLKTLNHTMHEIYVRSEEYNHGRKEIISTFIEQEKVSSFNISHLRKYIEYFDLANLAVQGGLDFTNFGDISAFIEEDFLKKEKAFLEENNPNLRDDQFCGYDFVQTLQNANDWFYSEYLIAGLKSGNIAIFHAGPPHYNLDEAKAKNQIALANIEAALLLNKTRYVAAMIATSLADNEKVESLLLRDLEYIGEQVNFSEYPALFSADDLSFKQAAQVRQVITELLHHNERVGIGYPTLRGFATDPLAAKLLRHIGPDKICELANIITNILNQTTPKLPVQAQYTSKIEYNLAIKNPIRTKELRANNMEFIGHLAHICSPEMVQHIATAISSSPIVNLPSLNSAREIARRQSEIREKESSQMQGIKQVSKEKASMQWRQLASSVQRRDSIPPRATPSTVTAKKKFRHIRHASEYFEIELSDIIESPSVRLDLDPLPAPLQSKISSPTSLDVQVDSPTVLSRTEIARTRRSSLRKQTSLSFIEDDLDCRAQRHTKFLCVSDLSPIPHPPTTPIHEPQVNIHQAALKLTPPLHSQNLSIASSPIYLSRSHRTPPKTATYSMLNAPASAHFQNSPNSALTKHIRSSRQREQAEQVNQTPHTPSFLTPPPYNPFLPIQPKTFHLHFSPARSEKLAKVHFHTPTKTHQHKVVVEKENLPSSSRRLSPASPATRSLNKAMAKTSKAPAVTKWVDTLHDATTDKYSSFVRRLRMRSPNGVRQTDALTVMIAESVQLAPLHKFSERASRSGASSYSK
jgi:hypothetical protein